MERWTRLVSNDLRSRVWSSGKKKASYGRAHNAVLPLQQHDRGMQSCSEAFYMGLWGFITGSFPAPVFLVSRCSGSKSGESNAKCCDEAWRTGAPSCMVMPNKSEKEQH